jgi:hypothetical protein
VHPIITGKNFSELKKIFYEYMKSRLTRFVLSNLVTAGSKSGVVAKNSKGLEAKFTTFISHFTMIYRMILKLNNISKLAELMPISMCPKF